MVFVRFMDCFGEMVGQVAILGLRCLGMLINLFSLLRELIGLLEHVGSWYERL